MQPILFELPGFRVHAYGLFMAMACAAALGITVWRARREGMNSESVYELATWLFLGGVAGARLLFVLVYPQTIRSPLDVLRFWDGGGVFYGCILGGFAGTMLYYRRRPFPFLKMADAVAPALAIGACLGRIGCHLNGCCHGEITSSWCAVRFPAGSHAWVEHLDRGLIGPQTACSLPVFPTQLYAAIAGLLLCLGLVIFHPHRRSDGRVMAALMIGYPITRWPLEMLRGDDAGIVAGVTGSMLISLALFMGGLAWWVRLRPGDPESPGILGEGRPAHA